MDDPLERLSKMTKGGCDYWYLDCVPFVGFDNPRYDGDMPEKFKEWVEDLKKYHSSLGKAIKDE